MAASLLVGLSLWLQQAHQPFRALHCHWFKLTWDADRQCEIVYKIPLCP
jgi:hypothetical protein